MSAHTPRPWVVVPQNNGEALIAHPYETGHQINPQGLRLVGLAFARLSSLAEDKANAALIIAAPDLLASLVECEDLLRMIAEVLCADNPPPYSIERLARARAAIAKANGAT